MAKRTASNKSLKKKETTVTMKVENMSVTVKRIGNEWRILKGGEK